MTREEYARYPALFGNRVNARPRITKMLGSPLFWSNDAGTEHYAKVRFMQQPGSIYTVEEEIPEIMPGFVLTEISYCQDYQHTGFECIEATGILRSSGLVVNKPVIQKKVVEVAKPDINKHPVTGEVLRKIEI